MLTTYIWISDPAEKQTRSLGARELLEMFSNNITTVEGVRKPRIIGILNHFHRETKVAFSVSDVVSVPRFLPGYFFVHLRCHLCVSI